MSHGTTDGQEVVGAGYETLRSDSGRAGPVADQSRGLGYDGRARRPLGGAHGGCVGVVRTATPSCRTTWSGSHSSSVTSTSPCIAPRSTPLRHGDRGANSVTLSCCGCGPELHGFWDGIVAETSRATVAAAFAATLLAAPTTAVNHTDVGHWVTDSFNLARSTVCTSTRQSA
jgi:hypothetical protein